MPTLEYRIYSLISRTRFNCGRRFWLPRASVVWQENGALHVHSLDALDRAFISEQDALDFGFAVARAWVDEHSET
jgi:hypothetical protein